MGRAGQRAKPRRAACMMRLAPDVVVDVSSGWKRAPGGMAGTIARRIVAQDPFVVASLEPVATCVRRLHNDPSDAGWA